MGHFYVSDLIGFAFTGLFEPGATMLDIVYEETTNFPKYPNTKQTWRLMYEFNFAKQKWLWNNLPASDIRKSAIKYTMGVAGLTLDMTKPFPFDSPDEVLQAIDQFLDANYAIESFDGLTKKQWRERAMNNLGGLTMYLMWSYHNTGIYLGWFSNKIGCPLNL